MSEYMQMEVDTHPNDHVPNKKTKWVFLTQLLIFFGAAFYTLYRGYFSLTNEAVSSLRSLYFMMVLRQTGITISISALLTFTLHYLIKYCPHSSLHLISSFLVIQLGGWSIVMAVLLHDYLLMAVYGILAIIVGLVYGKNVKYFPISADLLQYTRQITHHYPSLVGAVLFISFLAHFYGIIANLTISGISLIFADISHGLPQYTMTWFHLAVYCGVWFWFVAVYWTVQVLIEILRTIIVGVFLANYQQKDKSYHAHLLTPLIKHSLINRLGSIAYGSTLLSWVAFIRSLTGRICSWILYKCDKNNRILLFINRIMSALGKRFNHYAFNHIADQQLNDSYQEAAASTWQTMQTSPTSQVAADSYVGEFTFFASIAIGFAAACGDFLWSLLISDVELGKAISEYARGRFMGSWLLGIALPELYFKVIDAGLLATLVALAEDTNQDSLQRHPILSSIIYKHYPHFNRI